MSTISPAAFDFHRRIDKLLKLTQYRSVWYPIVESKLSMASSIDGSSSMIAITFGRWAQQSPRSCNSARQSSAEGFDLRRDRGARARSLASFGQRLVSACQARVRRPLRLHLAFFGVGVGDGAACPGDEILSIFQIVIGTRGGAPGGAGELARLPWAGLAIGPPARRASGTGLRGLMSRGARARVRGEPCASRRSNATSRRPRLAPSPTPLKTTPSMSETVGMIRARQRAGISVYGNMNIVPGPKTRQGPKLQSFQGSHAREGID